ncbi:MAG TPA: DUF177 domain-containing protein [Thermoanaerobaculia bacterium]|nr:DUF177 domain-containing protein [Thermoanaerobaculia bacterium]
MRVLLEQVRESPVEWQEDLELSADRFGDSDLVAVGPISCRGRISFVDPGFLIEAELRYEQTLACDRCLEPVVLPVRERFQMLAVKVGQEGEVVEELELKQEDLDVVVVGEELDTDPLVIEQIQLNVPMKPLCSESCRGLCPTCGGDLNRGACGCPAPEGDPRWAVLGALRGSLHR